LANAFGSEFEHRTLGQLLVQPCSRGRIYLQKLGVAGILGGMAAVAYLMADIGLSLWDRKAALLPLGAWILGLASAPLFTLITRSTLAGFLFSLTVPVALFVIPVAWLDLYHARHHRELPFPSREEQWLLWSGGAIYLSATALAGWRVFRRMEWREGGAGGGSAPGLHAFTGVLDRWLGRRWLRQPATAQLIRKELRLHVVPWLVAGILVGLWGLSLLVRKWAPESELGVAAANPSTATLFAGIFGAFVFLVTGASAIAEERALGTLEWQWTQPIPMARQWKIKVGVAAALALTLGLILPAVLVWLGFDAKVLSAAFGEPDWQSIVFCALALAALFATSLYASSVSQSSMKAVALTPLLLGSPPAILCLALWVLDKLESALQVNGTDLSRDLDLLNQRPPAWHLWLPPIDVLDLAANVGAILVVLAWLGLLARFTSSNAQHLRTRWSTVSRQWARLSGGATVTLFLGFVTLDNASYELRHWEDLKQSRTDREKCIEFATKAEQEGKFVPEYLAPLGITNRPSPEELVDALVRDGGWRAGFLRLSQELATHFQRKPVVGVPTMTSWEVMNSYWVLPRPKTNPPNPSTAKPPSTSAPGQ
jgi:ABC-type transport system involved in multi-copper enzyme maturation permease subunit